MTPGRHCLALNSTPSRHTVCFTPICPPPPNAQAAVFFHCATKPIKLLTVPAIPTMPSSKLTQPSAEEGIVRSQMSEMSCSWLADRSL